MLLHEYEKNKSNINNKRSRNFMLYIGARINENNTVIDILTLNEIDISDENGINDELTTQFCNRIRNCNGIWKFSGMTQENNISTRNMQPGVGDLWHPTKQKFYQKKPHNSWILDENTLIWEPPIPRPNNTSKWAWIEDTMTWILFDAEFYVNAESYNETSSDPDNSNFRGAI